MSDPIDRLSGFASSIEGEIMPRTAADARRRGDLIRRRRHALVAAGSAAAVVAVAVPVFAFGGGSDDADAPFGPATNGTSGTATLSADNLLADAETESYDGTTAWATKETSTGDSALQDAAHPCVGDSLGKLGAGAAVGRDWQLDDSSGSLTKLALDTSLHESVAQFDDARAARSAYDEIAAAMQDCSPLAATYPDYRFQAESTHDITIPEDGAAQFFAANYDGVQDPQGGGYTHVLETGLVVSGARVAVVTFTYAGQDFWPKPMEDMVPVAAQRLVTGTGPAATTAPPSSGTTSPPQAGSGITTTIPDDIPIDLDLVDMGSDGDYQAPEHVPASDFEPITLCSSDIWPPAHVDALSAWATGPEYSDRRDLLSFNSVDDAVAAVQGIRDDLQGCTRSEGQDVAVHQPDTGYDSVTFSTSCPAGGPPCLTMYQVTRVGSAVLLTSIYGEYSPGAATHVANVRTDITKNIATHLCVFTAAGCSGSGSGSAFSDVPLGPDGYGHVKLGMSVDQALATGEVVAVAHAHGGDTYSIKGDPTGAQLCFTPGSTLHAIFAPHGVGTPEGIGVGSTRDQLAAAYPSIAQTLATSPDLGVYDAPTGDGTDYRFDVERNGHVSTVILLDDQQQCFD